MGGPSCGFAPVGARPPVTGMNDYIYVVRPARPGFAGGMTADEERVMDEHFAYLKAAQAAGILRLAGPCTDAAFGIVLFRAESEAAAQSFMAGDPAVRQGVMTAELHRFRVSLESGPGPADAS